MSQIRVETAAHGIPHPVRVDFSEFEFGEGTTELDFHLLSLDEAEELADDLIAKVEEIREATAHYVQVQFSYSGYRYTYNDPSGTLQVGDLVEVPTTRNGLIQQATVVALGRGSWSGPTKGIVARFHREELTTS